MNVQDGAKYTLCGSHPVLYNDFAWHGSICLGWYYQLSNLSIKGTSHIYPVTPLLSLIYLLSLSTEARYPRYSTHHFWGSWRRSLARDRSCSCWCCWPWSLELASWWLVSILLQVILCPECHVSRDVTTLTALHILLSLYCLRSKISEINCGEVSVNPFATDTKCVDIIYTNIHTDTEIRNSVAKQQRRNTLKWLLKYSGKCHVNEKTRVTWALEVSISASASDCKR